jgi:cellulase
LGFVAPDAYASGDIICHRGATNAKASATVKAGGTVVMEWNTWPESHHGPVIDYVSQQSFVRHQSITLSQITLPYQLMANIIQLASCDGDCTTVDKTTLEFFKIDEVGLVTDTTSPGTWATDQLIANNNSWSITIPSSIAAGNYVLRHEIIALHSAENSDGAQNYPQCINMVVTGDGSDVPTGTLGESLYTETDPGILVNIYTTGLDYVIPGPALYTGGSSGAATTATAEVASSTSAAVVTSVAVATSAAVFTSAPVSISVPTTFATSVVAATTATSESIAAATPSATAGAGDDEDTCEA